VRLSTEPSAYGTPPIVSHAISLFQSLIIIYEVTELQVFAPWIEDLDLRTHYPSLQHLHFIVPSTINELSPYVQNIRSLLIAAPLQTIDLFTAPREQCHSYGKALEPFLRDMIVLEHPFLAEFSPKSDLDFEPLLEGVRDEWTRADKLLHIEMATNEER